MGNRWQLLTPAAKRHVLPPAFSIAMEKVRLANDAVEPAFCQTTKIYKYFGCMNPTELEIASRHTVREILD